MEEFYKGVKRKLLEPGFWKDSISIAIVFTIMFAFAIPQSQLSFVNSVISLVKIFFGTIALFISLLILQEGEEKINDPFLRKFCKYCIPITIWGSLFGAVSLFVDI